MSGHLPVSKVVAASALALILAPVSPGAQEATPTPESLIERYSQDGENVPAADPEPAGRLRHPAKDGSSSGWTGFRSSPEKETAPAEKCWRAPETKLKRTGILKSICTDSKGKTTMVYENGLRMIDYPPHSEVGRSRVRRRVIEYPDGRTEETAIRTGEVGKSAIPTDPLVFDLDGSGITAGDSHVDYDINGDGRVERVRDIAPGNGLLAFDADQDGVPGESGLELLGDISDIDGDGKSDFPGDGFTALDFLIRRSVREGVLAPKALADRKLDSGELKSLESAYGLSMKIGGFNRPAVPLRKAGVSAIYLSAAKTRHLKESDRRGSSLTYRPGATFTRTNGSTGAYSNLWPAQR